MWFEQLVGFEEDSPAQVRSQLTVHDDQLVSKVNQAHYTVGRLETPTLAELRAQVVDRSKPAGNLSLREVVADVQQLHIDAANAHAFFQVASQFNLLEMVSPSVTPEDGVGIYEHDRTQGPACAIACGAGTIYRNYFAEVHGQVGQTADQQIDCLSDLGALLGNQAGQLWVMKNGYAIASREGLCDIGERLSNATDSARDELRRSIRIGLQWNTQVTLADCTHSVSQAYCSALPVAYSPLSSDLWASFAELVLEAAYEATMCAAAFNYEQTGCNKVFLTLLGGGAFGNRDEWIFAAMKRAIKLFATSALDVAIVSYGSSKQSVQRLISQYSEDEPGFAEPPR